MWGITMKNDKASEFSLLKKLPPWARRKYFLVKLEFGARQFTIKDLENFFEERFKQTGNEEFLIKNVGELVAVLSRAGLIKERSDPYDSRRKIYQLVFPEFKAENLNDVLFFLFDHLRVSLNVHDSEKLLLTMLFYKTMSDRWHAFINEHKNSGIHEHEIYLSANEQVLRLYDPENKELLTWKSVVSSKQNINETLAHAFERIAELNLDRGLGGLTHIVNIIYQLDPQKLTQIIEILDLYDLSFYHPKEIGRFYRDFLDTTASFGGKYQGEFLTSRSLRTLLSRLLHIKNNSVVLDPAIGTGSLLIEIALHSSSPGRLLLLGVDTKNWAVTLAAMNALVSGIPNYTFKIGDSLLGTPVEDLLEKFGLTKADYVVVDPPWNLVVSGEVAAVGKNLPYLLDRDNLPSWRSADWLWVQLAAFYSKIKAAVVLHPGALSRSGAEKEIRKTLLSMDIIEAVIQLPQKLLQWTSISPIILVINKEKPKVLHRKVLMINVTEGIEEISRRLIQLKQETIDQIVSTYTSYKEIEGFSRIVSLEELAENDYNLSPQLYVFKRESSKIDTRKLLSALKELLEEDEKLSKEAIVLAEKILEAENR
ncbi:Site-specific DNA-methyltransferase (adenine-specific) [Thermococcus barophilus]|uniref:site-specific DNA-methyltransferase (adenine-specific) n=2 Tax=Thermococcus barophilus TaxID=55802 RepID=A0A0S1XE22_THEBA|nr:Site-specific DNA-methyltransferase (adenine-specific) [Thermococcus barophilus]